MKKDRNSFFSQFGSYGYNNNQMPVMPQPQMSANASYQMQTYPVAQGYESDIDARLSKIERELNRMDARLSKLESSSINSINSNTNTTDYNFANSMYMV